MFDDDAFYRRVTEALCRRPDLASGLDASRRVLASYLPADFAGIDLIEGNTGSLRTIAVATAEGAQAMDRTTQVPIRRAAEVEKALVESVVIINRSDDDPVARRMAEEFGVQGYSLLVLHLYREGIPIGGLVLAAPGPDRYTEEHGRRLALLGAPFSMMLASALRHREIERLKDILADDNRYLHGEIARLRGDQIIGEDFGLAEVMELVRQVAPRDSPVLLLGETGVGKDVIAQAIHAGSPHHHGPMIKVNCGAIPETLLDSELFGHEKGAFTGALSRKRGRFERAQGGSIFLDEVGELPAPAQVRLLRVLQSKEIERVGGTESVRVDARVIAATNRDLEAMVAEGAFRQDLWFRLNVFPVTVPPLRERTTDIPALVQHFVDVKARNLKLEEVPGLHLGDLDPLMAYEWPGNVRELENVVERALILSRDGQLSFDDLLPTAAGLPRRPAPLQHGEDDGVMQTLDEVVAAHIRRVLDRTRGRVHGAEGAAATLGLNASTLRHRMDKLGIVYGRRFGKSTEG